MKTGLNNPITWHNLRDDKVAREDRPTLPQAAEWAIATLAEVDRLKRELAHAEKRLTIAAQRFDLFALEVSNLANKARVEVAP